MDLLDGLRAFVATAQTGSFTAAADRLGISNRLTSKYVAELETRVGARLLQRTTRKVGLTPAGQELLGRAPALLSELDDVLGGISEQGKRLSGVLRISAPVTFGEIYLRDLISRFAQEHPELVIDLRLNDSHVDLASDGFDLAIRIGIPEVASLKTRQLGQIRDHLVASPDYLAKHGHPQHPDDLAGHGCIIDTNRREGAGWAFTRAGETHRAQPGRRLMVNSARVARDWARQGCGIAMCPSFVLEQDLANQTLVPLLTEYQTQTLPICAVYLTGHVLPRKVRALIDFAVEDFARREQV